jgi:membrane protease YdiL (CAAX protease family)
MGRLKTLGFLVTIAALLALEVASIYGYRLNWVQSLTPLGWTAIVRSGDIALFLVIFRIFSIPVSTAGLRHFARGSITGLALSFILGGGFFGVAYAIRSLLGIDLRSLVNPGVQVQGLFPLIVLCLLGPFAEEIFFRGLWYNLIRAHQGVVVSVAVSAALFGATHLLNAGTPGAVMVPALGGIVLALLYESTQSLVAPFILHGLANLILFSRII